MKIPRSTLHRLRFMLLFFGAVHSVHAQSGSVSGSVVSNETAEPLPYSLISLEIGGAFFANDSGRFMISGLPVGPMELQVRRLGYSPSKVTVNITDGGTQSIVVRLSRLAVTLNTVTVQAYPPCTAPGAPSFSQDSTLARIFDQVHLNAEQFLLLSES